MSDPIELPPLPTVTTLPKLTPMTLEADQANGVSPPGAGGWTPKQLQAIVAAALVGGAWACLDVADAPDLSAKRLFITFAKGAVGFLGTYLGLKSAGPRKVQ